LTGSRGDDDACRKFATASWKMSWAARREEGLGHGGVDAALEAEGGVGLEAQGAGGWCDGEGFKVGGFERMLVVFSVTSVSLPPMTPAMATGFRASAMTSMWGSRG